MGEHRVDLPLELYHLLGDILLDSTKLIELLLVLGVSVVNAVYYLLLLHLL